MIDLASVAVATMGGIFSIIGPLFLYWLQQNIKDKQAAIVIGNAVTNSLGAIQHAAEKAVEGRRLGSPVPGLLGPTAHGVAYVKEQAAKELARFPEITDEALLAKIEAKIGLKSIDTNIAVAASPGPTPKPLDPVAPQSNPFTVT